MAATTINLDPRTGEEVVKIISEVYNLLDPELACKLVNPNVVLAIAGVKRYADIPWIRYTENTESQVYAANLILKSYGMELSVFHFECPVNIFSGSMTSLKGLERTTHLSSLPWMVKYTYSSKIEDLVVWSRQFKQNLISARERGEIPVGDSLMVFHEGIRMGYPDQAIYDFEKALRLNELDKLIRVELSYPKEYFTTSAVPNFTYYPEHKTDAGIVEWVKTANKIFDRFYGSVWYTELISSAEFLNAQELAERTFQEGFQNRDVRDEYIKNQIPEAKY